MATRLDDLTQVTAPRTLREHAFYALRSAILDGTIPPGQVLHYQDLALRLGVSTTPVREALRSLEVEGLVRILPHHSSVVAQLSIEDLEETYAIRLGLEGLAARLAAERMTDEILTRMQTLVGRLEQLAAERSIRPFLETERLYHNTCYSATGREQLCLLVDGYRERAGRYLQLAFTHPRGFEASLATQHRLLGACEARDGSLAESVLQGALRDMSGLIKLLLEESLSKTKNSDDQTGGSDTTMD